MTRATEIEHRIGLKDGRTLACLELGDPDGAPVLYFHGFPGSRLEARLASVAAAHPGFRLLAPDRPGFGDSTFQPGRTIGAWPVDVVRLAEHFALERFGVVGVSAGGPYALACAAHIPDRLDSVSLVCPLGPFDGLRSAPGMMLMNRLALLLARNAPPLARLLVGLAVGMIRAHPERYLAYMRAGAATPDREVLDEEEYRALIGASTAEALRRGGRGAALELTLLARPWDFGLTEIAVPMRLWHGLADTIVPVAMARRLAGELPNAEPRYLAGEGHLSLIVRHLDAVLNDIRR